MRLEDAFQSKWMRAADLRHENGEYGTLVATITQVTDSGKFDDGTTKRVLHFKEHPKPLALGKTTWKNTAKATGEDNDDHWVGKRIELWVDENVEYQGDTVAGIRIRKVPVTHPSNASAQLPPGVVPASSLPLANKASAWAAWKRQGATGSDEDKANFKKACDIEAINSKTPIENFGAVQWANVAERYPKIIASAIADDDIPFAPAHHYT